MPRSTNPKIDTLLSLSQAEFMAGSLDSAIKYAEDVRGLAVKDGDKSLETIALHRIAGAESERGNHARADELLTIVAARYEAEGAMGPLTAVLIDQGIVAKDLGRLELAEQLYGRAIELSRRNGFESALVSAQGNLAQLARRRGQAETAMALLDEVVAYLESHKEWGSLIPMLNIQMELSLEGKRHSKLLDVAQKLKAAGRQVEDAYLVAAATANMGHAYNGLHQFQESKAAYREALEYFKALHDLEGMSNCYTGLASAAQIIGTDDEMMRYLYLARNPTSA